MDKSNGYERIAPEYISGRGSNRSGKGIGASTVAAWARTLPPKSVILDLGCGTGLPISQTLIEEGHQIFGIDASPSMIAAFRKNFPAAPCDCAAAEDSSFFHRSFDAIVSWGLMFLLDESTQHRVIAKAAAALNPGGLFLFTAPQQAHSWTDAMTDLPSRSLGYDAYQAACESVGLTLIPAPPPDAGGNYYYLAQRAKTPASRDTPTPDAAGDGWKGCRRKAVAEATLRQPAR